MLRLKKSNFIEYPKVFEPEFKEFCPSPLFRKSFYVKAGLKKAELCVCGLGYGRYYINGIAATDDLFTAPVSDYDKTLWYNSYDITDKIAQGENLFAAILGNGFYNEPFKTGWDYDKASWRDNLKLAAVIELTYDDGKEIIETDKSWKCNNEISRVRYNYLRSGEYHDFNFPDNWNSLSFNDEAWEYADFSSKKPKGSLRKCRCQPIRERKVYAPIDIFKNSEGSWVLDFGQNMSGYLRAIINQKSGDVITIRYSEDLKPDGTRELNGMDGPTYYTESEFQTDRFVCNGREEVFTPLFVYHGFRYAIIDGLSEKPDAESFRAVFVSQEVEEISEFSCSDETINRLYYMGKMASLSNMFYMLTDCPTREKLGWCNDARASTEQLLQNFDIVPLLKKWIVDIYDSIKKDGSMPGIVPTAGWGYEWGSGPLSNSILFEIPYKIYRYYDDASVLKKSLPYFKKYLDYASAFTDSESLVGFGLCDWAGPFETPESAPTPLKFTDTVLLSEFYAVAQLAARLCGNAALESEFEAQKQKYRSAVKDKYMDKQTGRCKVDEQTAVAMIIMNELYDDFEPIKAQMKALVEKHDYHLNCGMLGIQYLYFALDKCGLEEYAYKIITAKSRPSYREWIDNGATTMWEMWNTGNSKNHHMYSGVLSWFNQTIAGLRLNPNQNGYKNAIIKPAFLSDINECSARYKTAAGEFSIYWKRIFHDEIELEISAPSAATLDLGTVNYKLTVGKNIIKYKLA